MRQNLVGRHSRQRVSFQQLVTRLDFWTVVRPQRWTVRMQTVQVPRQGANEAVFDRYSLRPAQSLLELLLRGGTPCAGVVAR